MTRPERGGFADDALGDPEALGRDGSGALAVERARDPDPRPSCPGSLLSPAGPSR